MSQTASTKVGILFLHCRLSDLPTAAARPTCKPHRHKPPCGLPAAPCVLSVTR